ncbi:hypothetical protein IR083_10240 [Dysgonomonas sp. GY75]|uniref:hypothetical protein n=1 Tax=Dysgonomonas sp. GY75 TaxID=2780419 RepID=UPI001883B7E7|nr:hypothetical protein [Dysgonomonas sp. GY75]MBF0649200.1 hypothetical protein [Dysgonomonas sp. GY75]
MDDHTELAFELVTLDIRAQQAHRELQSYNDTGKFQYVHRLTVQNKYKSDQLAELRKLKSENPADFMNEVTNVIQNIRRIESQLHKKKYKDEEERQSWENNLEKARIKQKAIQDILS